MSETLTIKAGEEAAATATGAVETTQTGTCFVNGKKDPNITTKEQCAAAGGRWVANPG